MNTEKTRSEWAEERGETFRSWSWSWALYVADDLWDKILVHLACSMYVNDALHIMSLDKYNVHPKGELITTMFYISGYAY